MKKLLIVFVILFVCSAGCSVAQDIQSVDLTATAIQQGMAVVEDPMVHVQALLAENDYEQAQTYMLQYPFEGMEDMLATCNDVCFLTDLAKGWEARCAMDQVDIRILSNKQAREHLTSLVESELQHVGKYASLSFRNTEMAEYAYTYLAALQNESIGAQKYGIDPKGYQEYWDTNGSDVRNRIIYLMNKNFGLTIAEAHQKKFESILLAGRKEDSTQTVMQCLIHQLEEMDLQIELDHIGHVSPRKASLEIWNTTEYSIRDLHISLLYLDQNGNPVLTDVPADYSEITPWNTSEAGRLTGTDSFFGGIAFQCKYRIEDEAETHEEMIFPRFQYSWDGQNLMLNGIAVEQDAEAQGDIAEKCYAEQDDTLTVDWYRQAAEQGYIKAQYDLGEMYYLGKGVTCDYELAVVWWKKAAEQGHAQAQYNLGAMYYKGEGITKDFGLAVEWWDKAAEQGYIKAQYELGQIYYHGQGIVQDYGMAIKWYRKAAEQGHVQAQCNLGIMYANGKGVSQDYDLAAECYRKAAEQGHAQAQCLLGLMYYYGTGVAADFDLAVKWLKLSAEQEYAAAQEALSILKNAGYNID